MHILLIHQYFLEAGAGGGSRFNEMARIWVERGHRVTVLAGMVGYTSAGKAQAYKGRHYLLEHPEPGVRVLRCHVSERYNTGFGGRLWGYVSFMFSSVWGAVTQLDGRYDVVLATSPPLFVGLAGAFLARAFRAPFVFEVRDLWPESAIDMGVLRSRPLIWASYRAEALIYSAADRINVLTPAFARHLAERKGVAPRRILQVPNAADFSLAEAAAEVFDRDAFRAALGWQPDEFVALYVGAHGLANGLHQLIEAAGLLAGTRIRIVTVGQGMERAGLAAQALAAGLPPERFAMLGPLAKQEVFRYVLAADCGLSVLLRNDTFKTVYSNKTFDYMACARPIVLAIDGVSRELIETAHCGIFAEPEDPQAIATALRTYAADPLRAQADGQAGHRYARIHFDRHTLATRYIEALEELVRS